jgi:hypothetical protein
MYLFVWFIATSLLSASSLLISGASDDGDGLVWGLLVGSSEYDESAYTMSLANGNVLIGGYTYGNLLNFIGTYNGTANGANGTNADCFYAVYEGSTGELINGVQFGAAGDDGIQGVDLSSMSDKIAVSGFTNGGFSSSFGYRDITPLGPMNGGNYNGFVGIYEPVTNNTGNTVDTSTLLWGRVLDDDNLGYDVILSVRFGPSDVVAVGGIVSGPVSTLTDDEYIDGFDAFVAVFSATGDLMWAHSFGSTGGSGSGNGGSRDDIVWAVVFDEEGNLYAAGFTEGELNLPPPYSQTKLNPNIAKDCFIVKYDSSGVLQWGVQFGTNKLMKCMVLTIASMILQTRE